MPAPTFSVNAFEFDPYRTFKFQVLIDGRVVAALKKMTALKRKTEAIKWRAAGDPSHERIVPGGTSFEPVTLEQGLTHDPVFENWANLVSNLEGDGAISLANFRKDIVINVLNLQGNVALSYHLRRAWVSDFQALPDLDAATMNAIAIQSVTLQHEGWSRDTAVAEPVET
jgi:phage tail-like protein